MPSNVAGWLQPVMVGGESRASSMEGGRELVAWRVAEWGGIEGW